MQVEDRTRMGDYGHVYLSPHMDDAAISCGGRIIAQTARGERVLVVTLCTAAPAPEGPFSDLAREFHAQWSLAPEQAIAARLEEERLAMRRLGADYLWAGMLDAIYRYPAAYNSRASLFNAPAPDDPLFASLREFVGGLRERRPHATFYAPLGVGSHVDHLITHAAVRDTLGNEVRFYEELPYVIMPGALDQRLAALDRPFAPNVIAIDTTLEAKIDTIAIYASQMVELFGSAAAMAEAITGYAATVPTEAGAYGERLWLESGQF